MYADDINYLYKNRIVELINQIIVHKYIESSNSNISKHCKSLSINVKHCETYNAILNLCEEFELPHDSFKLLSIF